MFRRKKGKDDDEEVVETTDEATTPARASAGEADAADREDRAPTTGPYDAGDVADDGRSRIDLGALLLAIPEGVEVRVDVSPEGVVQAVTVVHQGSSMQLNAFAAPRREGIWGEVRAEIAEALRTQGGSGEEVEGPFGTELRARIPSGQPGVTQPARFLGSDGPRWFLRALITGPASTDAAQAAALLDVYREIVVVRGKEAMAPRDQLPLRLPKEAQTAAAGDGEQAPPSGDDFNPFERGPEITEVR